MENILNITNGDMAVKVMKEAGIPGVFLPWRDVLHDGPVPSKLSLTKLSEIRAQFIIDQGWGEEKHVREGFVKRDDMLQSFRDYSKVTLWFEHDLYDQLQILQILDWFSDNPPEKTRLTIICTELYLGLATPHQIRELPQVEETATQEHLRLAKKAWSAFRSSSPEDWQALLNEDTSTMPFLRDAIFRLLEEYPSYKNGLSRTAYKALEIIAKGEKNPGKIFKLYQKTEERIFMGDLIFWAILFQLSGSDPPLVESSSGKQLTLPNISDQELSITSFGEDVLAGKRNWFESIKIDHWIGGVHLIPGNMWCWNSDLCRLQAVDFSQFLR